MDINQIGYYEVILCQRKEIFKKILILNSEKSINEDSWDIYKSNTCYDPNNRVFSDVERFKTAGYKVHLPYDILRKHRSDKIDSILY